MKLLKPRSEHECRFWDPFASKLEAVAWKVRLRLTLADGAEAQDFDGHSRHFLVNINTRLVLRLVKAKREGTLDGLLADAAKARLLVPGEFGYVPFGVDGARLPCQVISESHGRRSVISATNVESGGWGTVFADDKLAAAIVDRVVHHGRLVEFGGPSHGLEESLMLGKARR